jgi:hypothetical protein
MNGREGHFRDAVPAGMATQAAVTRVRAAAAPGVACEARRSAAAPVAHAARHTRCVAPAAPLRLAAPARAQALSARRRVPQRV